MTDKDNKEGTMNQHEEIKAGRSIPIESKVIGKENAAILRERFDQDENNEISAAELGQMAQQVNQKDQKIHRYQYALIGLAVAVVLLLCTTFATSWLAVKLQKDLEADNDQNLLISKKSGEALATLVHNQFCKIDFDYYAFDDILDRRKLISEDAFHRYLQETPAFVVPAACAELSWARYEKGNLGVMQFSRNSPSSADGVEIGLVGTEAVARDVDETTGDVTYGPLSRKGDNNILYEVRCSANALTGGDCQGFLLTLPQDESGRVRVLCPGPCWEQPCDCFSPQSTVELEGGEVKTMRDLKIGDKVLVGPNKYQEIYSFGHKLSESDATGKTEYRKISVVGQGHAPTSSSVLEVSPDHLIYRHGEDTPVPASVLEETDLLVGKNGEALHIRKIETVYQGGLYHPYTADGTIVVGGILASTFLATRTALILFWLELTLIFHGAPLSIYNCATYGGVMLGKYLATEEANPPVQLLKIGLTAVTLALIAVASVVTSLLDALSAAFFLGVGYVTMRLFESYAAMNMVHAVPMFGD
eukprot:CAMPEP_0168754016 /NCGR_PEP_ID=MMETSP0724-20121128/19274_1 /TAXON_ID=265536 /ORGANISM="Amphiprora sp., Strain CCMP467" /LENGTH=531 /DNA_ID=CAMNT_0008802463 /DNA_START=193 /DNA_END=1789 /DNA_ORIENTATION=-